MIGTPSSGDLERSADDILIGTNGSSALDALARLNETLGITVDSNGLCRRAIENERLLL